MFVGSMQKDIAVKCLDALGVLEKPKDVLKGLKGIFVITIYVYL
jgi:hypothetical protein